MKIYTRTGDQGETGLFGGGRVPKDDVRVDAYGEIDELNSVLGGALLELKRGHTEDISERLLVLQSDLFAIGAHLATPSTEEGGTANAHIPPLPGVRVAEMERWIDEAELELEPLREFILPGGTEGATRLHLARTVCRRAERRVVALSRESTVDEAIVRYLNRMSDLLFTWARLANRRSGEPDVPWKRADSSHE